MTKPTGTTTHAWTSLLRAHDAALSRVECALKDAGLPPLPWYDVLLELERAGENGIRPYLLQEKLLLPQYGLSRLLDRMEREGYLERYSCPEDGRGQHIAITPTGQQMRKKMWAVYGPAIEQVIGRKLTPDDAKKLSGLLNKLL